MSRVASGRETVAVRAPRRSSHILPALALRATRLLGVLGLCCTSSLAHADIYRYVDQDGVIHFSNTSKRGKLVVRNAEARKVRAIRKSGPEPSEYDAYIREAAQLYQIPEALVRAVIRVESNFDPRAVSHANAQGLMQLTPARQSACW